MFKTFIAYFQLLPAIIDAVKAIEAALPEGGQGAAKLKLVTDVATALQAEVKDLPIGQIVDTVSKIVASVVGFFNSVGLFAKKASA